jgi:cysteine desulfurase
VPAYLDCAATTPMRREAVDAMAPYLADEFGNPSGAHRMARRARKAIDESREILAGALGVQPREIVFCSGGTESDNLAVQGVHRRRGGTVVASAVEHHAVLDPVVALGGRLVGVDSHGVLDLDGLADALDPEVTLVSVMLVNNETGVVTPFEPVVDLVRERAPNAYLHTDAVQAFCWLDLTEVAPHVDLLSLSAHKFGGPKGVGALMVREGTDIAPLLLGGGQERELRSGTQNVAGIAAMGAAADIVVAERVTENERVTKLRDRLLDGLLSSVDGAVETGAVDGPAGSDRSNRVAGTAHLCFADVEAESLLFLLERDEVYASAASSCASGAMEPSHVLAAMGVPRELAGGSLRLSLGWCSDEGDVDQALAAVPPAVERLRSFP